MQGHLYVENKDTPKLKYQSRFFVLFPFCGLRWFTDEPEDTTESNLLTCADDGGWIFGGNIRISSVVMEEPDDIYADVFPFSLFVMSSTQTHQIRLAADDEDFRIIWTDEIKKAIFIQNYIHSCIQCNAVPSKVIFCAALAGHDSVNLENVEISVSNLGSLVMVCKFNFNLGTSLKAVHVENAQLADSHCPLLASLLSFTPLLESLSLSNNYITDDGFDLLVPSLQCCRQLNLVDFSSNFLSDVGVAHISPIFRNIKRLRHLDLSRNRMGTKSAKSLALHLSGYGDSRLTYLNLSYNSMGNSVAQLVSLLLSVENSKLVNVDVSFCHLTESGFKELCSSVPRCQTLQLLNLSGNFADDATLGRVVDCMTAHQKRFGLSAARDGNSQSVGIGEHILRREALFDSSSVLDIQLGGMMLTDAAAPKCLSFTTMRSVLAHVSEKSSTTQAVLRRRMDVLFLEQNDKDHTSSNHQKRHVDMRAPKMNVIVCIRVQLMPFMETVSELMESLSDALKCDLRQLHVLSASEIDESDSTFVIFTALDATSEQQLCHMQKTIKKSCLDNKRNGTAQASAGSVLPLPSAEKIGIVLQQLAHTSSPLLRCNGVRSVYIQRRDRTSNEPVGSSFHCHVQGGGSGGRGLVESFLPPLSPHAESLQDMRQPPNSSDPYWDERPPLDLNSVILDDSVGVGGGVGRKQRSADAENRDLGALNDPSFFFQEDEGEGSESALALSDLDVDPAPGVTEETNTKSLLYNTEDTNDVYDGNAGERSAQISDDKFLSLIHRLKLDYEINTEAGEFWAAVFGDPADPRSRDIIDTGLKTAFNGDGVFHDVGRRQEIVAAMFERDRDRLAANISLLKSQAGSKSTHSNVTCAIELGERLLNEIAMLRHDAESLDGLAQGPEDICIVEEFLINCGRIGYTGPEILVAVELREYLVQWAMELDDNFERTHLGNLKQRALITNLMISRNFEMLESRLSVCQSTLSEGLYEEASTLLGNYKAVRQNLSRALAGSDRVLIENVLAEAAYYNIYDDIVVEAIEAVNSMSSGVATPFADIVNVLQTGDRDDMDKVFEAMDDIGWKHAVVDQEAILKILDRRNQLIEETNAMNDLIRISNLLQDKNEAPVSTPPVKTLEIMACIRLIKTMGLAQLQEAKLHITILENQVKKAAIMASQEDEILQLIDTRDYEKLSEMLSGVGSGTLVMSAPNEEEMVAWLEIMSLVCRMGSPSQMLENSAEENEKLVSLYRCGVLEKAARGKEKIHRNWRQRYFVLDGLTISYYTKEGGERKGCVRVGGGKMRKLDPKEEQSSGKRFCFELQEGRDLSAIDPDLIKEAHRLIREVDTEKHNEALVAAVAVADGGACSSLLKEAADRGYELETELVGQAKMLLLRLQQIELKKELRTVCKFIPRGQIQEVIKKSNTFRLDQDLWMCRLASLLTERAEAELAILRSRGWLKMQDDSAFKRSLTSVQRFDVKRLGSREKKLLAAVLLQHAGATMDRSILREGAQPSETLDSLAQTLEGVMQYFVETEPMQLARLVIATTKKQALAKKTAVAVAGSGTPGAASSSSKSERNVFLRQQSSVFIMPDNSASSFLRNKSEFSLEKYAHLRSNSQLTGFLRRKGSTAGGAPVRRSTTSASATAAVETSTSSGDTLHFSTESLVHPLLRLNKSIEREAVDHFKALQVVMGDRTLQSGSSSRSPLFAGIGSTDHTDYIVLATRMVENGISTPLLRDELYVHLLKQISGNPNPQSLIRAWILLSVYLHCFSPSAELFPYVRHFFVQASLQPISAGEGSAAVAPVTATSPKRNTVTMKSRLTMAARLSLLNSSAPSAPSTPATDLTSMSTEAQTRSLKNLISYCSKVLKWTEDEMAMGIHGFKSDLSIVDERLLHNVMNQTKLKIKIGVMTGSVYEVSFYFGDIANVFSLLALLFEQIVGNIYINVASLKTMPNVVLPDAKDGSKAKDTLVVSPSNQPASPAGGARGPSARVSVLERSSSTFFGDRTSASGFKHPDIIAKCFRGFALYDDVENMRVGAGAGGGMDARTLPVQPSHSGAVAWDRDVVWDSLQNYTNSSRLLYLRRKIFLVSELLIDSQLDLFGDEVSDKDPSGLRRLWVKWLCDPLPDLPVDHVRVDMLFAEESRYVNSQLYGVSDDGFAYLAAMQLLLSWDVEEEVMQFGTNLTDLKWGSGHAHIMRNIDSSVRPSAKSVQPSQETVSQNSRVMGRHQTKGGQRPGGLSSTSSRKPTLHVVLENDSDDEEKSMSASDGESDDDSDDASKNKEQWHGKALDINALEDEEVNALQAKLRLLGTSEANNTPEFLESVAYFMSKFQAVAMQFNISTQNQRFRYMMKTAYLGYAMSWPLAGGNFAMASCDVTGEFVKTLVCVSGNGIYLLTVDDWALMFHAPLYDIDSYDMSSAQGEHHVSAEDELLTIVINELEIKLISTSASDLKGMLDGLCLELLSKGVYRHGLEGGFDILDADSIFVSSTDPAAVLGRFQTLYAFLPGPPTPLPLVRARSYVEPPKSKRAILAEARAEEERIEIEQARLAAQAAADRNQAHIEKGRQALTTMMEDDGDDDDDDDEGGNKRAPGRVKKQRRRVSLLGKGRQHINPLQLRMQMVESAVCGVSLRPSIVPDLHMPPTPDRRTGMRTDSMLEACLDLSEKPPLISEKEALDTTVPFSEEGVRALVLTQKEESSFKHLSFPLVPVWGVAAEKERPRSSLQLPLSMGCEWLCAAEDSSVVSLESELCSLRSHNEHKSSGSTVSEGDGGGEGITDGLGGSVVGREEEKMSDTLSVF